MSERNAGPGRTEVSEVRPRIIAIVLIASYSACRYTQQSVHGRPDGTVRNTAVRSI